MALELIAGAALGTVFGEFVKAVSEVKNNAAMFRAKLEDLEATLHTLAPVIEEIERLNTELNRTDKKETEVIMRLIEKGKKLVSKCSNVECWNCVKKSRYEQKIVQLDNSLLRIHIIHMQAHMAKDIKHALLTVRHISSTLNDAIQSQAHHLPPPPTTQINISQEIEGKASEQFAGATSNEEDEKKRIKVLVFNKCREEPKCCKKPPSELQSAQSEVDDVRFNKKRMGMFECGIIKSLGEWKFKGNDDMMWKAIIEQVEETMESLFPVAQEIYNKKQEQSGEGGDHKEAEKIMRLMEDGKKLLGQYSKIGRWNFVKKRRYQKKVVELDNKLLRFHSLIIIARDHDQKQLLHPSTTSREVQNNATAISGFPRAESFRTS